MKIVIIIFALVFAFIGALLYLAYPILIAIRTSKGVIDATTPFERTIPNARMTILVAGDSTGVGVGAASPQESVAGRIAARYPDASVENIAVTGMRLAGLRELLESRESQHYTLMVLHIGANDVTGGTPLAAVERDLRAVLEYATTHADTVVVLTAGNIGLAPPFRAPVSWYLTHRTQKVRSLFMETIAAYDSVHYVDLYKSKEDDVFRTNIPKYYAADRFHPSSDGYAEWYASVEPILNDVVP